MSGTKYLLDTNFILGMLKSTPVVLEILATKRLLSTQCGFSAVTRMELLGFPGITPDEEHLIRMLLDQFRYLGITFEIEEAAIEIRRARRMKLPDALIAATARCHGLELLTLDAGLQTALSGIPPSN
jgi:predicted nucleic acid-binding protein